MANGFIRDGIYGVKIEENGEERRYSPREVIENLRRIQPQEYEYDEFLLVLKRRLRRWTGQSNMMFLTPSMIVDELINQGIVEPSGKLNIDPNDDD